MTLGGLRSLCVSEVSYFYCIFTQTPKSSEPGLESTAKPQWHSPSTWTCSSPTVKTQRVWNTMGSTHCAAITISVCDSTSSRFKALSTQNPCQHQQTWLPPPRSPTIPSSSYHLSTASPTSNPCWGGFQSHIAEGCGQPLSPFPYFWESGNQRGSIHLRDVSSNCLAWKVVQIFQKKC